MGAVHANVSQNRESTSMQQTTPEQPVAVAADLYLQVQRFLYKEASLLDRRAYSAWLSLLTEDVQYKVTAAVARDASAAPVQYSIIEESLSGIKARVEQISNPRLTRAENPPSLLRRFVSNIEAYHTPRANELAVTSYLLAHRVRPNEPQGGLYVAEREDLLRIEGANLLIARRTVRLDQTILFGGALSALL